MQCPVCHNEVGPQAAFCNHCGAPIAASAPPPAYTEVPVASAPPPASYPPPPAYPAAGSSGLSPTAAAAIAYITFIPAIIFLVIEPYNKIPLVRFHSMQSIALNVVWCAFWILVAVLSMFLALIPGLRLILFLFPLVHLAIFVGVFILWLMAIMKANKGEFYKLPIIGDFAMKQAQS
jgi:uncharacterized membrane protein